MNMEVIYMAISNVHHTMADYAYGLRMLSMDDTKYGKAIIVNNQEDFFYYMEHMGFEEEALQQVWKARKFSIDNSSSPTQIITDHKLYHLWCESALVLNPSPALLKRIFKTKDSCIKKLYVLSDTLRLQEMCIDANKEA